MSGERKRELLSLAIGINDVRDVGSLTVPRSFGVYRVTGSRRSGRLFRYGNHPIRQRELIAEYGGAKLEALFAKRSLAKELAGLLNNGD